jgi:hypothetical protein
VLAVLEEERGGGLAAMAVLGSGEAGRGRGNARPAKTVGKVGAAFDSAPKPANLRVRVADLTAPSNSLKVSARVQF